MARKNARHKKPQAAHNLLAIRLARHDVHVDASINPTVYAPQYALRSDEGDPVYKVVTHLTIIGLCTYPDDRVGDAYEVTIYGNDSPSLQLNATLKNVQARDKHGSPQYRRYRGREIPVYNPPAGGIGHIEKVRGERRWMVWLFLPSRFTQDALALLGHQRTLYLAINECQEGKSRWVRSIALQTTDPAEE